MTKRELGILTKLRNNARSKSKQCYTPNCRNKAIRSHIHSVEYVLRGISENNKVIQLESSNPFFTNLNHNFKLKGIKGGDVMTFWGFCQKCDSTLFKSLEQKNVNYELIMNQKLLAFRALHVELNKIDYNLRWYQLINFSNEISELTKKIYRDAFDEFTLKSKWFNYIIQELYEEIRLDNNESSNSVFKFFYGILPRIEVCASESYSLPVIINDLQKLIQESKTSNSIKPLFNTNIVSLIPDKKNLNIILGSTTYNSGAGGFDFNSLNNKSNIELSKGISDLLIRHCEQWVVSPALFSIWKQARIEEKILLTKTICLDPKYKQASINYNIFDPQLFTSIQEKKHDS